MLDARHFHHQGAAPNPATHTTAAFTVGAQRLEAPLSIRRSGELLVEFPRVSSETFQVGRTSPAEAARDFSDGITNGTQRIEVRCRLRILVIGAGVGGVSIARGLLRDGHDVTVFERRPALQAAGGAVTIWSNGATVLGQLGVDMDGAGQLLSTLRVVTSTGRPVATLDLSAIVDRLGAPVRMVPRRVLLERLLEGFPT